MDRRNDKSCKRSVPTSGCHHECLQGRGMSTYVLHTIHTHTHTFCTTTNKLYTFFRNEMNCSVEILFREHDEWRWRNRRNASSYLNFVQFKFRLLNNIRDLLSGNCKVMVNNHRQAESHLLTGNDRNVAY